MLRDALLVLLLAASLGALADAPAVKLRIESSVEGGLLTVVPRVAAPAGSRLRYEIVSSREGSAGKSSTSQSGSVSVGDAGSAKLSTLSLSVDPQDRYVVTVKVFDGARVVAEDVLRYPK